MVASFIRKFSRKNCTICRSIGCCWWCRRQLLSHIKACLLGF